MKPLLDLDQLRTFLLITETGSFTKTADTVFRTQSAISMQIRRLEERVGKSLFTRVGRHLQLTPYGEDLQIYASRMLQLNDEAINSFRVSRLQVNIRIGLPDIYLEHMLHDALKPILHNTPEIETILQCEPNDLLISSIRRGALDLALITHQAEQKGTMPIRTSRFVWVTSATNSPHMRDVLPLATSRTNCSWRIALTDMLNSIKRKYRIALSTSSNHAIILAVRSGTAISMLPENMVTADMRILNEDDGFPPLPSGVLTLIRSSGISTPAIDMIAKAIQTSFSKTIRHSN